MYSNFFARPNPSESMPKTEPKELPWLPVAIVVGVIGFAFVQSAIGAFGVFDARR